MMDNRTNVEGSANTQGKVHDYYYGGILSFFGAICWRSYRKNKKLKKLQTI